MTDACWDADAYFEVQQLRYCLAMVARAVSRELVKVPSSPLNISIRKDLYNLFSTWCDEGNLQGQSRSEAALLLLHGDERVRKCGQSRLGRPPGSEINIDLDACCLLP